MTQDVAFSRTTTIDLPENFEILLTRDRVLVRPKDAPAQTKGGIYLPEDAQRRPQYGIVLAVGPSVQDTEHLRPGSIVVFPQYVGLEVKLPTSSGEETYLVMEEKNILGVIKPRGDTWNDGTG